MGHVLIPVLWINECRDHTLELVPQLATFWGTFYNWLTPPLTHWGWVTHICVCKLTIIGSDNGLSPDRRQAIIWTNVGLLLNGLLGTNFSEILIEILTFSFKKMRLKVSSAKRRPFCLSLNVLMQDIMGKLWGEEIDCVIMAPHCIYYTAAAYSNNKCIDAMH